MSLVVSALRDVAERLSDPRRWVQGTYAGLRTQHGVIPFWQHRDDSKANCWCLSTAITLAVNKLDRDEGLRLSGITWTELRSEVERELLLTLDELGITDNCGNKYAAIYQYNDWPKTAHGDVLACIDKTLERLAPVAA